MPIDIARIKQINREIHHKDNSFTIYTYRDFYAVHLHIKGDYYHIELKLLRFLNPTRDAEALCEAKNFTAGSIFDVETDVSSSSTGFGFSSQRFAFEFYEKLLTICRDSVEK